MTLLLLSARVVGDEREAQQRFLRLGLGTAQLVPGVFRHLGTPDSLRERVGQR
jgi:hypothetical protein